jgi:transcriptional repressor NrdR
VRCPFCGDEDSRVVDSRDSESGDAVRRRRECGFCGRRYTTYERVEEAPVVVVKRSGAEEVFARAKLLNGLLRACEKRRISLERIERVADEIEGELRRESVQQVTSAEIGERALRHLRDLDLVAYIRFASVYRQFDDIEEFQKELARLDEPTSARVPAGPRALARAAGDDTMHGAVGGPGRAASSEVAAVGPRAATQRLDAPVDQPAINRTNGSRGQEE